MKFGKLETIKEFRLLLKELSTGLRKLSFNDNFESFEVDLTFISGEEKINVRNELNVIPKSYIITFQTGDGLITASDIAWTKNYITFKNHGTAVVRTIIKVIR